MSINEDIKQLVVARLEALPSNRKISVGSAGEFTPEQLIEHVQKGDDVGKKFVQVEMEFLQAMKEGIL